MLDRAEFHSSVSGSLAAAGVLNNVNLVPGFSPDKVVELAQAHNRRWSLLFIDGNHDTPYPLNDTKACEPFAEPDAMMIFHDLASPEVSEALDYLQDRGWNTMIYQTMQVMGVAWRGNVTPADHFPDPSILWPDGDHLLRHPFSGWQKKPNYAADRAEILGLADASNQGLGERRRTCLFTLARYICERDLPGNFFDGGGALSLLAHVIRKYSKRPRKIYRLGPPDMTPDVISVGGPLSEALAKIKAEIGFVALIHDASTDGAGTTEVLRSLYDQVPTGGYVLFGDYAGNTTTRKAVHAFEHEKAIAFYLNAIDVRGAWARKS